MSYIGISKEKIKPVALVLNELLASYSVYYQNLRAFHWNVIGDNFFELHAEFENIYNDAKIKIDEIAERILTIGHTPISSMSKFLKYSKITEADQRISDKEMVTVILKNQTQLISLMRKTIERASQAGDEGTVDLLGGMLSDTEKRTWMLGAWSRKH